MLQLVISQGLTIYTHTTKPIEKQEGYSGWLYIYIYIAPRLGSNTGLQKQYIPGYNALSIIFLTHTCSIHITTVSVQQEERITVDGAEWPIGLLARD